MSLLILYTTSGCHLCEEAKVILWPLLTEFGLRLREIDIADSDALIEQYSTRIPVVAFEKAGRELEWPFITSEARDFIAENTCS